ncbi:hypothetical protein [Poseidonocella sedimentorum]|uniref:VPLPA-CTERM protein sorting domain-containing protein n=1 Tax=Poseidonocella sedimentorum TaxID=871652 RepID=A0A1I6DTY2_9RHOB|nr:hypothetical protein [Poseidonocella sedimentorum]SFR08827.1 VPLPA-CTERM protein sorting domain-containing protein [Poseidonocella sedimentorum]
MRLFLLAGLIAAGTTASAATYTQITDPGDISAGALTETFEGFTLGTPLPLSSGIMSVATGNAVGAAVVGSSYDHPGTPAGSRWIGNSADAVSYSFEFSAGISQFGLVLFGHQYAGTTMELFDALDQSVASFSVAIAGGGAGQYTGFTSDMAAVRSVVIDFGGVDAVWIDNVSYLEGTDTSPVPLPATLPLLVAALGASALAGRRKRG